MVANSVYPDKKTSGSSLFAKELILESLVRQPVSASVQLNILWTLNFVNGFVINIADLYSCKV